MLVRKRTEEVLRRLADRQVRLGFVFEIMPVHLLYVYNFNSKISVGCSQSFLPLDGSFE